MSTCLHDWRFWGDDSCVHCNYCGEIRDALNGSVVRPGSDQAEADQDQP